tara:strand:- start:140 stop:688 length:549 start_codon:yes stop_codon:yes gene_type:complete
MGGKIPFTRHNLNSDTQALVDEYIRELDLPSEAFSKKGVSLIAPTGAGKTYFINNQQQGNRLWIDADPLMKRAKVLPEYNEWSEYNFETIAQMCDMVTVYVKQKHKLRILGSTWWDAAMHDAMVIPDVGELKARLSQKEDKFDDSFFENNVLVAIKIMEKEAIKSNVPIIYDSIENAVLRFA